MKKEEQKKDQYYSDWKIEQKKEPVNSEKSTSKKEKEYSRSEEFLGRSRQSIKK